MRREGGSDGLIPVGEDQIISLSAKDQKVGPLPPRIWEPQFPVVFWLLCRDPKVHAACARITISNQGVFVRGMINPGSIGEDCLLLLSRQERQKSRQGKDSAKEDEMELFDWPSGKKSSRT